MNDQEFKQLVTGSVIFKDLTPEVQAKILESTGKKREEYIRIFTDLKNGNVAAAKKYLEKNEEIVKTFKTEVKTSKQKFLKKSEEKRKNSDDGEAEKLLEMIKNI